jgi:hypothetical protein
LSSLSFELCQQNCRFQFDRVDRQMKVEAEIGLHVTGRGMCGLRQLQQRTWDKQRR